MDQTPNLDLPYIAAAQAQKHITHNEALRALDALIQIVLESRNLTTPPLAPQQGKRYHVGSNAIGDWQGKENQIAAFQDNGWIFYPPHIGWLAWILDENKLCVFEGSGWVEVSGGSLSLNPADLVGVNTMADSTNKLAVKSDAVLLSHDDVTPGSGSIQAKFNKKTTTDTASILYQTDWSGRAEMGLTGNDDFHLKVSGDGTSWKEAMVVKADSGKVGFGIDTPVGGVQINHSSGLRISTPSAPAGYYTDFVQQYSGAAPFYIEVKNYGKIVGVKRLSVGAYTDSTVFQAGFYGVHWETQGVFRAGITRAGKFGIGTTSPTSDLHVDGVIRCKSYVVADLPDATSNGAGAQIFVSDEAGGSVMAFCDGANWRRCTDRAVVS